MKSFLLLWDGSDEGYDPDEYLRNQVITSSGERPTGRWSFGRRVQGATPGDRVFLLRQHSERGIVASGYMRGPRGIYEAPHWDPARGGTTRFIDVEWDAVVPLPDRLPVESLLKTIPLYNWNFVRSSGNELTSPSAEILEETWIQHVNGLGRASALDSRRAELIPFDPELIPDSADAVSLEETGSTDYVAAGSMSTHAIRREAQLVDRLSRILEDEGHKIRRYRISIGRNRFLYTDISDLTANILWEAKGVTTREAVRTAIGQLMDYRRFIQPKPRLAVLLPERPETDLQRLLKSVNVELWYEAGGEFFH